MRKPFIAGNWKLNKYAAEVEAFCNGLKERFATTDDRDILIAPVALHLQTACAIVRGTPIHVAAQNVYFRGPGAYTGEISPAQLKDIGCSHCIIGHSERRTLFHEQDAMVNLKARALLAEGIKPIICIGETLPEREAERVFDVIERQVMVALHQVKQAHARDITIAYEPIWAIGTGKTATPEMAQEVHAFIRGLLAKRFSPAGADAMRILYGGSVKPANVNGLMAQRDIDGALVGGASLKIEDFSRLITFDKA